jgi:hypothetical protein
MEAGDWSLQVVIDLDLFSHDGKKKQRTPPAYDRNNNRKPTTDDRNHTDHTAETLLPLLLLAKNARALHRERKICIYTLLPKHDCTSNNYHRPGGTEKV